MTAPRACQVDPTGRRWWRCSSCREWKPASAFAHDARKTSKLDGRCRACEAQRKRDLRASRAIEHQRARASALQDALGPMLDAPPAAPRGGRSR